MPLTVYNTERGAITARGGRKPNAAYRVAGECFAHPVPMRRGAKKINAKARAFARTTTHRQSKAVWVGAFQDAAPHRERRSA